MDDATPHSACTAGCCRLITVHVGQSLQFLAEHTDGVPDFHSPKLHFDELEALSMMDRQDIDQIALRLVSLVPPGLAQAQQDLRTNFQDVLVQGLRRLDLVTREEFEVQTQVLARTRAKVDELERRVAELEAAVAARER
jgi:ubiquinone biosynthesis accessory factor UbiK